MMVNRLGTLELQQQAVIYLPNISGQSFVRPMNDFSPRTRKLILKERYFTSSHNYFFELKEAVNGSKYIVIDQRRKVDDKFVSSKMRIFEDEMLEFERIFHNFVNTGTQHSNTIKLEWQDNESSDNLKERSPDSKLFPSFFSELVSTSNWRDFESYTYYLLQLLGLSSVHTFLNQRQSGKADGFFKIGNLAVIYDCTLDSGNIAHNKSEQIKNYCNCLEKGSLEISKQITEEFHNHCKQVWIITQRQSRKIKNINCINVKEVSVQDIINLYKDRLTEALSIENLEMRLRDI